MNDRLSFAFEKAPPQYFPFKCLANTRFARHLKPFPQTTKDF